MAKGRSHDVHNDNYTLLQADCLSWTRRACGSYKLTDCHVGIGNLILNIRDFGQPIAGQSLSSMKQARLRRSECVRARRHRLGALETMAQAARRRSISTLPTSPSQKKDKGIRKSDPASTRRKSLVKS